MALSRKKITCQKLSIRFRTEPGHNHRLSICKRLALRRKMTLSQIIRAGLCCPLSVGSTTRAITLAITAIIYSEGSKCWQVRLNNLKTPVPEASPNILKTMILKVQVRPSVIWSMSQAQRPKIKHKTDIPQRRALPSQGHIRATCHLAVVIGSKKMRDLKQREDFLRTSD